ncbi:Aldo/keto reductase [Byssothecium circinans]|uniref:Aldo/keto reductase n=1 Tax=Byssothecium circinans TaxID=147558 RepID=A0A6A5TNC4_9PLEO|nr:Aldo/keto reductase [Byssothecium circinans]
MALAALGHKWSAEPTIEHPLSISSSLKLATSGYRMPQLGFGVYLSKPPDCVKSCLCALKAGYRHIDTAQYYANEASVGRAIRDSGIPRSEIFITTKILSPGKDIDTTLQTIKESVKKLDDREDGYVDLFLIHSPNGGPMSRRAMWLALEKARDAGLVRDIGVSNYGIGHIEEIKKFSKLWPVVNQIELHPWCQQPEIVDYCEDNMIVIEAYCPLVRNQKAHDKTLVSISEKHKRPPNQILIRWSLQHGWVPLPKSDKRERIISNADVYGFELDDEDMEKLDGLDRGPNGGSIVQLVDNSPTG